MDTTYRATTANRMAIAYAVNSRNHHLRILATLPPQDPARVIHQEAVTHLTATIEHLREREGATA